MKPLRLFISSVQKEFATERAALRDYLRGDVLMRKFFEPFLFEEVPAADRRADAVYLDEVQQCDLYIGLFGDDYGFEDAEGVSPTEREFAHATTLHKSRLIFVKGSDDRAKHPKMRSLIQHAGNELIRRRFGSTADLIAAVYASLVQHLEDRGALQSQPFDERLHAGATLDDVDPEALRRFVRAARHERQFALAESAPVPEVLTHLNLLREQRPTQGALLLFGRDPQRFFPAVEVRCMHLHGTVMQRPAPFYRVFKGTAFALVDQAVDFVLSKLDYQVGTRAESAQAPGAYELPPDVIREAVVNAIAHRDYTQPAAVQVAVFSDRVEVRSPGGLLPPLTEEALHRAHSSVTRNQRLCEVLYLARYIEKFGTGTLMMIQQTTAHALPEPDFEALPGEFMVVLWRDWLTPELFDRLGLNKRQRMVMGTLHAKPQVTNADYQQATGAARTTVKRDLEELVRHGLLRPVGAGRGAAYVRAGKRPTIGSIGSSADALENGPEMAQSAQRSIKPAAKRRTLTPASTTSNKYKPRSTKK